MVLVWVVLAARIAIGGVLAPQNSCVFKVVLLARPFPVAEVASEGPALLSGL